MSTIQLRRQHMDSEAACPVVHLDGNLRLLLYDFFIVAYIITYNYNCLHD